MRSRVNCFDRQQPDGQGTLTAIPLKDLSDLVPDVPRRDLVKMTPDKALAGLDAQARLQSDGLSRFLGG